MEVLIFNNLLQISIIKLMKKMSFVRGMGNYGTEEV
jgi:hypothetical protein